MFQISETASYPSGLIPNIRQGENPNKVFFGGFYIFPIQICVFMKYYETRMINKQSKASRRNFGPIILDLWEFQYRVLKYKIEILVLSGPGQPICHGLYFRPL